MKEEIIKQVAAYVTCGWGYTYPKNVTCDTASEGTITLNELTQTIDDDIALTYSTGDGRIAVKRLADFTEREMVEIINKAVLTKFWGNALTKELKEHNIKL